MKLLNILLVLTLLSSCFKTEISENSGIPFSSDTNSGKNSVTLSFSNLSYSGTTTYYGENGSDLGASTAGSPAIELPIGMCADRIRIFNVSTPASQLFFLHSNGSNIISTQLTLTTTDQSTDINEYLQPNEGVYLELSGASAATFDIEIELANCNDN